MGRMPDRNNNEDMERLVVMKNALLDTNNLPAQTVPDEAMGCVRVLYGMLYLLLLGSGKAMGRGYFCVTSLIVCL